MLKNAIRLAVIIAITVLAEDGVKGESLDLTGESWSGCAKSTERVKEGAFSWKWDAGHEPGATAWLDFPAATDWSRYRKFRCWIYSEAASNAIITLCLMTDEKDQAGSGRYFLKKFKVNWDGWNEVEINLDHFEKMRAPSGFGHIKRVEFLSHHNAKPVPGTILYLTNITLE